MTGAGRWPRPAVECCDERSRATHISAQCLRYGLDRREDGCFKGRRLHCYAALTSVSGLAAAGFQRPCRLQGALASKGRCVTGINRAAGEIGRHLARKPKPGEPPTRPPISIPVSYELAQRAIDGYLETLSRALFEEEYHAWQFLDRAIELAGSIHDRERCAKARHTLLLG